MCLIKYVFVVYSCMEGLSENEILSDAYPLQEKCCTKNVIEHIVDWAFWNHACFEVSFRDHFLRFWISNWPR